LSPGSKSQSFKIYDSREISTQYFSLKLSEISLDNVLPPKDYSHKAVGGGVISRIEGTHNILHIDAYGNSTLIDIASQKLQKDFFPPLDTGAQYLQYSKFYTLIETSPRVLGVVNSGDVIYVSYNYYDRVSDKIYFCVSQISFKNPKWVEIYRTPPIDVPYFTLGNGGKLAIHDDKLFFTIGDQSLDRANGLPSDFAPQNWEMPWGKTLYFVLNKFPVKPVICSVGHRNPQGLLITSSGTIYETEHGPRGGDELNVIKCGGNYGWPNVSYGTSYWSYGSSFPPKLNTFYDKLLNFFKSEYVEPIYFFTPSPALTSLIQINNFSNEWDGDLLLGSLKATSLYRVKLADAIHVKNIEQINLNSRVRDMVQIDGQIVLLTDGGTILLLSKSDSPLFSGPVYPALNGCLGCHVLKSNSKNPFAPSLSNVYGANLGSSDYEYSASFLLHKNIIWNDENLRLFLQNPQKFIPGTKMPAMYYKPDYIVDVIKELKLLKSNQK